MGREEEIRIIAYHIWEEESYSHGRDVEHWLKAEVIWEEIQKSEAATGTKAKSKQITKQGKKGKTASKKH